MAAPTKLREGATYNLKIIQGGSGSYTLTWNAVFKWPNNDVAPILSIGVADIDIISFLSDGTNLYGVFNPDFA